MIAVFKNMAGPSVSEVEIAGIERIEVMHRFGERAVECFDLEMIVIVH